MRSMLFGTNWKMNKTREEAKRYCQVLKTGLSEIDDSVTLFIIPPYTSIDILVSELKDTKIKLGVQNIYYEKSGPFTGEISALMAKDAGAQIIEIGHSDRRTLFNDTDEIIARKTRASIDNGLIPLICVGENEDIFNMKQSISYVRGQVAMSLSLLEKRIEQELWIAYEPLWAIGTKGKPASPDHIEDVHQGIREELYNALPGWNISKIPILYGGSVNRINADNILCRRNVNGLFIGRAADEPNQLLELIQLAGGNK